MAFTISPSIEVSRDQHCTLITPCRHTAGLLRQPRREAQIRSTPVMRRTDVGADGGLAHARRTTLRGVTVACTIHAAESATNAGAAESE